MTGHVTVEPLHHRPDIVGQILSPRKRRPVPGTGNAKQVHGDTVNLPNPPLADEGGDLIVAESGADCEGHSDRGLDACILCPSGASPAQDYLQKPNERILLSFSSLVGGQDRLGRLEGGRSTLVWIKGLALSML